MLQTLPDGLAFGLPPRWTAVEIPPAQRAMRKAMLRLPAAAGAPDDAELVVYFFGAGQGGTVEANLTRWCGQFEVAGGGNPRDAAKVASRTVNGLRVTTVDLAGTYVAAVMPGAAEKHQKPGYRMLAAIVETAVGPFFLKCVGPDATLAAESAAFDALVGSVQRAR